MVEALPPIGASECPEDFMGKEKKEEKAKNKGKNKGKGTPSSAPGTPSSAAVTPEGVISTDKKVASWRKTTLRELTDASTTLMLLDGANYVEQLVGEIQRTQKEVKDAYNSVNNHVRRNNFDEVCSIKQFVFV